jgi:hypothetical protein
VWTIYKYSRQNHAAVWTTNRHCYILIWASFYTLKIAFYF